MNEDKIKRMLAEWIGDDEEKADLYRAYLSGVNVGMEVEQSGRAEGMSAEEYTDWLREMFESRVEAESD